ncbi:Urease accessory protein G [Frankliniella fusca]|uniref:Urease accessory protein G n=1 Tax=Frankliniella fusca TaxID=407009 RepID=A0AAE1HIZ9_9NEOP|nr:Urease accessory protein G [Frankliniella fusca]
MLGKSKFAYSGSQVKKKAPIGAFTTPFELANLQKQSREERALNIPDEDVQCKGDGQFTVKSATLRDKAYNVTENSCSCPDSSIRKSICKHILRVRKLIEEGNVDVPSAHTRKRKHPDDSHHHSQQTRSGRVVRPKEIFSPSKQ